LTIGVFCAAFSVGPEAPGEYNVTMELSVDGVVLVQRRFTISGAINLTIGTDIPASPSDRTLYCYLETVYSRLDAEERIPGSGPETVRITVGSFIPYEWIWGPFGAPADRIWGGDDRGFVAEGGSARLGTVVEVVNPAYTSGTFASGPHPFVGMSEEFEYSTSVVAGHLTGLATGDWVWGPPMRTRWATAGTGGISCTASRLGPNLAKATTSLRVVCEGHVNNPLVSFSPDIDYKFDIELTFGNNRVLWKLHGCHDEFPAFEAYIEGRTAYQQAPIGEDAWSVFGYCTYPITLRSGVIP
jgi:hypothetical protein